MDKLKTVQANISLILPQPTLSVAGFRSDNGVCFNSFHLRMDHYGVRKYRNIENQKYEIEYVFFNTSEERAPQFSSATDDVGRGSL